MPMTSYKIKDRICYKCGKTGNYKDIPFRYYDEKGCWDRKSHICNRCYKKEKYYKSITDPDSIDNLLKSLADFRNGNLRINSNMGKSIIDQAVIAAYLEIDDLNIKTDNFEYYIDLEHNIYKKIDVKGSVLGSQRYIGTKGNISIYYEWTFRNNRKIDCDHYFCIGYDSYRKKIESVYIIPNNKYISDLSTINIHKRYSKYDKFKVDSKSYDDIYQDLMMYIGDRKYFGVEDIKNWIKIRKEKKVKK